MSTKAGLILEDNLPCPRPVEIGSSCKQLRLSIPINIWNDRKSQCVGLGNIFRNFDTAIEQSYAYLKHKSVVDVHIVVNSELRRLEEST